MLQEIQEVKTPEELETFMLKHGENIIDTLGAEVDRLEKELKNETPRFGTWIWRYCKRGGVRHLGSSFSSALQSPFPPLPR